MSKKWTPKALCIALSEAAMIEYMHENTERLGNARLFPPPEPWRTKGSKADRARHLRASKIFLKRFGAPIGEPPTKEEPDVERRP